MTALLAFLVGALLGAMLGWAWLGYLAAAWPAYARAVLDITAAVGSGGPADDDGRCCMFSPGEGPPCPEPWASRESCLGCPYLAPRRGSP